MAAKSSDKKGSRVLHSDGEGEKVIEFGPSTWKTMKFVFLNRIPTLTVLVSRRDQKERKLQKARDRAGAGCGRKPWSCFMY